VSASYCHCTRCQRRTGAAASANGRAEPGTVRVTQGEDELRAWAPEGGFEKLFCGLCGSALFSRPPGTTDLTGVRLGAVDGDPGIRPQWHQFVAYAAPWEPLPDDGLPRYDERPPA
ncbi:MAG TPA: GFA family protein, partial [Gaiellaceae bacterium]|nr:GFA family protein [Gaiellaceae bacterium]